MLIFIILTIIRTNACHGNLYNEILNKLTKKYNYNIFMYFIYTQLNKYRVRIKCGFQARYNISAISDASCDIIIELMN
jgi:uncharacterized protein (DUF1810 family)